MDNICETVFTYAVGHVLAGKSLTEFELGETDYSDMQELLKQDTTESIKKHLEAALDILIKDYYENDRELLEYLSSIVSGVIARLKNAADNKVLNRMI